MSETTMEVHKPSDVLLQMIEECATKAASFYSSWQEVLQYGKNEGFEEEELIKLARPYVREKLISDGYNGKELKNKLYNIFHAEQRSISNKRYYDKNGRLKTTILPKNDTEDSSIDLENTPREKLIEIIKNKDQTIKEKNEVIKDFSFNDNPEVFTMNIHDSEHYFGNVTRIEGISLLKGNLEQDVLNTEKINLVWERVV